MPLSTTAKAALCLCPPAVMVGTVTAVPSARRAVHHLTAPRHPVVAHHGARPEPRAVNCNPAAPAALPAVPLVTYAAPIPAEPTDATAGGPGGGGVATGPGIGVLAGGAPAAVAATGPTSTPPIVAAAVPEPATWLMLFGGVGAVGAALRRRRRPAGSRPGGTRARASVGAALWSGGAVAEAGDMAATAAVRSVVAAKSTAVGIAGKAMLCVCPAAVVAGGVMAVPSLRHAVHASTAPPIATGLVQAARPCDVETTVPVAAAPLAGLPATVTTVTAPQASTPSAKPL